MVSPRHINIRKVGPHHTNVNPDSSGGVNGGHRITLHGTYCIPSLNMSPNSRVIHHVQFTLIKIYLPYDLTSNNIPTLLGSSLLLSSYMIYD